MSPSLPVAVLVPGNSRLAIAQKGFRPFFLLSSTFALLAVPFWSLVVFGIVKPVAYLDPITWHAHEMIFGFATGVIAGFLLTAVANWTQRETLVGAPLLALAALWTLGRLAMMFSAVLPRGAPALVDLAFLPALMVALVRPLVEARSSRNFVVVAVLSVLFAANAVVHLDALGAVAPGSARRALLVAIDVIMLLVSIIAGRVFPMFTRNTTGSPSIRSSTALDVATALGLVAFTAMDALVPDRAGTALVAGASGVLAAARAARWGSLRTARHPLLWVLHLGYAWIPVGLVLRCVCFFAPALVPRSLAIHALTVGAIGSLTLGMMARVALGHTGRALAAPRPVAWAFVAMAMAAIVRVLVPLFAPGWYVAAIGVAAVLWAAAFLLHLSVYAPILLAPRVDGKRG
jgi:uncharacterized protein involved in response to NO